MRTEEGHEFSVPFSFLSVSFVFVTKILSSARFLQSGLGVGRLQSKLYNRIKAEFTLSLDFNALKLRPKLFHFNRISIRAIDSTEDKKALCFGKR